MSSALLLRIACEAPACPAELLDLAEGWRGTLDAKFSEQGANTLRLIKRDARKVCSAAHVIKLLLLREKRADWQLDGV